MRILILGGGGMLGHKMFQTLARRFPDTWCTLRSSTSDQAWQRAGLAGSRNVVEHMDASDLGALEALIRRMRPEIVVNCIGVIKQRSDATAAVPSITLNALLPHRVAALLASWGGRLIHFSTDCVFSGSRGDYTEADPSDADDLYGRSKYLGEVAADNALTLRTSIIGRELQHHSSLLDWFLSQNGRVVSGYQRAWWSGVTTNHLAEIILDLVEKRPDLSGLYQLSSGKISKYELLNRLKDGFDLDIEVKPDDRVFCDRSLKGDRFVAATGYRFPSWDTLIRQLVEDPTPYPNLSGGT